MTNKRILIDFNLSNNNVSNVGNPTSTDNAIRSSDLSDYIVNIVPITASLQTQINDINALDINQSNQINNLSIFETSSVQSVTANSSLNTNILYFAKQGTGDYILTLPDAVTNINKSVGVKVDSLNTNFVTLTGVSGQTIDNCASRIMWARENILLLSDGVEWKKINGCSLPLTCSMTISADYNIVLSSNQAKIQLNKINTASNSNCCDVLNNRILIKRSGYYLIYSNLSARRATLFSTIYENRIFVNGTCVKPAMNISPSKFQSSTLNIHYDYFNTGDYIEQWIRCSSGTTSALSSPSSPGSNTSGGPCLLSCEEIPSW